MSLPNIPNITPSITINREDAINLLIASIAMEELGLSHIINAEGEKIQYVLGQLPGMLPPSPPSISEVLAVNEAVRQTLNTTMKKEMFLQSKLETVLNIPNTYGPPGPTGATGATGPPGSTGATGATGPSFTSTNAFAASTTSAPFTIVNAGVNISLPDNQVLNGIIANETNDVFIIPSAGVYLISYSVNAELITNESIRLIINGSVYTPSVIMSVGGTTCFSNTIIIPLAAGATLALQIVGNTRAINLFAGSGATISLALLG